MSIRVHGKGRRERSLPLWKTTAAAFRAWLAIRGPIAALEVFVNARGEPMSRWGFAYVLHQHAQIASKKCPSLPTKKLSPHVLRHMSAMIVLQATHDIRKVSLWLGHSVILGLGAHQTNFRRHRLARQDGSSSGEDPSARVRF